MKTILIILAIMITAGCYTQKVLQSGPIRAKLIKIDTIQKQQQLTWKDINDIEYVTFAPLHENYQIGTRMVVLKER